MKFNLCEEVIPKKRLFAQEPDLALLKLESKCEVTEQKCLKYFQ